MEKIRFGIVGTGNIAHRFAQAIRNTKGAVLTAVASRTAAGAQAFGDEFNIPHRFTGYEAKAASDAIACERALTESPLIPHAQTLNVITLTDTIRGMIGVRYPQDLPERI